MNGDNNTDGQDASARKRSASNQSQDERPPAKKLAAPAPTEEEKRRMDKVAEEVKATVRTIFNESRYANQYCWQATALPQDIIEMLGKIEDNFRATFSPGKRHPIYVKYGKAGSDPLEKNIKTNGRNFGRDMEPFAKEMSRASRHEKITILVLIHHFKHNFPDNWEQRELVKALRDDLPPRQGGMEDASQRRDEIIRQEHMIPNPDEIEENDLGKANLKIKLLEAEIDAMQKQREKRVEEFNDMKERQKEMEERQKEMEERQKEMEEREKEMNELLETMQATIRNQAHTIQDRDQAIATGKAEEKRLRQKVTDLVQEKAALKMEQAEDEMKRDLELFGAR
ncbi:hypothetical protein V8F20_009343 [Naviculisporaceae sp. PSN 640]